MSRRETTVTAAKTAVERRRAAHRTDTSYPASSALVADFSRLGGSRPATVSATVGSARPAYSPARTRAHAARTLLDKYVLTGEGVEDAPLRKRCPESHSV